MLPNGFHFEQYVDGPGLYLGDRVVASACPANYDPDPPWRLCINPAGLPRYVFTRTEADSIRYMEAWARKWESRIKEEAGRTGNQFAHLLVRPSEQVATTHHRRRRTRH